MKASITYKTHRIKDDWLISHKEFMENIENSRYSLKAENKYRNKEAQPPTKAIRNAGFVVN